MPAARRGLKEGPIGLCRDFIACEEKVLEKHTSNRSLISLIFKVWTGMHLSLHHIGPSLLFSCICNSDNVAEALQAIE